MELWYSFLELPEIFRTEPIFQRALIAAIMVGITCGILGCFFVLRNMSLIGDALSHAILPGLVVAFVLIGYSTIGFFIGSTLAGMLTAIMITWITQNIQTKADASIGIVFTFMFALGIIGISSVSKVHADGSDTSPHIDMQHFLFGNILGVETSDLYLTVAVMLYVIISIYLFYRYLFVATFQEVIAETMGISVKSLHYFLMLLLSFTVVASLKTVGLILVVAMLITPASTALLLSDDLKKVIVLSALIGAVSGFIGLCLAIVLDAPPGPELVVVVSFFYLLAALFAPRKGYFTKKLKQRKLQKKIQLEDILKQSIRITENGAITREKLTQRLAFSKNRLQAHLKTLQHKGLLDLKGNHISLTIEGKKEANRLVRAHRLWETYLVQQMGMTEEQIHEEAEHYEHLLTEDILEEVDEKLGFPRTDPHGSPIPTRKDHPDAPLSHLDIQMQARIDPEQTNEYISAKLWELGLMPNVPFTILNKDKENIQLTMKEKTINVPIKLARAINISTLES